MWYVLLKIIFKAKYQNEKYKTHLNTKKKEILCACSTCKFCAYQKH